MNWKIDSLSDLKEFLLTKGTLYAPSGENPIQYKKIDADTQINLSRNSDFSPREIWQPRTHYYLKSKNEDGLDMEYYPYNSEPRIVFGLRPCDMKGLDVFAQVFNQSGEYKTMLEDTIIIGYLCEAPGENCFCEAMGGLPDTTEKMDLVLYRSEGQYIISSLTDRGFEVLKKSPFTVLTEEILPVHNGAGRKQVILDNIRRKLDDLNEEDWEKIAFPCINCRICTYVCPTCHCFTITDEVFKYEKGRAVVWDSCQSQYFTKEASGMNPRGSKTARVRNRMLHKIKYHEKKYGEIMCSGCGRCISNCPVGLDLFEELSR
ncbi:MAG: Anaerobic sulfite reductase subunit A [Firmicutes bacterium ADurb.Bin419]|nr:MAG: Anaerobic sulfite reductase subunit A [Firmicutes bacterium ADurb.Bin419]